MVSYYLASNDTTLNKLHKATLMYRMYEDVASIKQEKIFYTLWVIITMDLQYALTTNMSLTSKMNIPEKNLTLQNDVLWENSKYWIRYVIPCHFIKIWNKELKIGQLILLSISIRWMRNSNWIYITFKDKYLRTRCCIWLCTKIMILS